MRSYDCILMETLERCVNFSVVNFNDFCMCIINKFLVVTQTCQQRYFASVDSVLHLNVTLN